MHHPCYGRYSAHHLAPCGMCALRGPCSSRVSDPEGFVVLHHPRYRPPGSIERAGAATAGDPSPFYGGLRAAGMSEANGWWRACGRPVARLLGCSNGRVEVEFADLRPASVASLVAAAKADVFPKRDPAPKRRNKVITRAMVAQRRAEVTGCVAVLGNPVDAVSLVVEVVKTCYAEVLR